MSLPVKMNSQKILSNDQAEFSWRTLLNEAILVCPGTKEGSFGMFIKQKTLLASLVLHSGEREGT